MTLQTAERPKRSVCALTMARNDPVFLRWWIEYYGRMFGPENLFVLLDGLDQPVPEGVRPTNLFRLPHVRAGRAANDRRRAELLSDIAGGLFRAYDTVIVTDVDEFLVVDPACGRSLFDYLQMVRSPTVSALGLDVAQHLEDEAPLDHSRRFLEQRSFAHVSARYTKPVVATRPVRWGSGIHRVKGRNFRIDPNLYLMHFGLVDQRLAEARMRDADRLSEGWQPHFERRKRLFRIVTEARPVDGDAYFPIARRWQRWVRPLFALNKPAPIPGSPVVRLPRRFRRLV